MKRCTNWGLIRILHGPPTYNPKAHPVGALQAFAEKLSLTYPLLSDFSRETVQKYGMMVDDPHSVSFRLAQRAYVVIDQQGIIRYKRILEDPDHALDSQEMFTTVQKIVAGIQ
jgi:glutaredoxin-dependent peroxiredoxin